MNIEIEIERDEVAPCTSGEVPWHVASDDYPSGWRPECAEDVWISAAVPFCRAARAWCAAAEAMAQPLVPAHFLHLVSDHYRWEGCDPNKAQLGELLAEAIRRAEWAPRAEISGGCEPFPKHARLFSRGCTFGMVWHSSVQTILARTARGWEVRIIGNHPARREAAEVELVGAPPWVTL